MFVVRLVVTWLTRDRIRIWWEKEKEKEKERLPTSLFVRLKKLSRRQDLKKNKTKEQHHNEKQQKKNNDGNKLRRTKIIPPRTNKKTTQKYPELFEFDSLSSLFSLLSLSFSLSFSLFRVPRETARSRRR